MNAMHTFVLIFIGLAANVSVGLVVLALLDNRDDVHAITRRWNDVAEFAAIALWPLAVLWLLWQVRRRGRA